jgi:hypothetical protein
MCWTSQTKSLVLLERGMSKFFILPYFKEKSWETLEIWSKRNLTLALFHIYSNVFACNFYIINFLRILKTFLKS